MKGFKAFNKDMKCHGFQYEEGKTYEFPRAIVCQEGAHFCINPLDCLNYYDLVSSEFHEVESLPDAKTQKNTDDSKVSTTKIKIGARLGIKGFVEAAVNFLLENSTQFIRGIESELAASGDYPKLAASGDYSKLAASGDCSKLAASGKCSKLAASGDSSSLAASGDYSKLAASGYSSSLTASGYYSKLAASGDSSKLAASGKCSKLAASGDYSKLELNGQDSVGANIGMKGIIKGKTGNWITLAEWKYDQDIDRHTPICVKSAQIDGKTLKEDVWYTLKKGAFVEVE